MASNLQLISGSPLIGSPIVYQVTAGSPVGDVTFQRVKIYVKAGLSSEGVFRTYPLSQPVQKGETVRIDISSALQAVADGYEYEADPPQLSAESPFVYPYIQFSLKAYDEYMQNGQNSGDVGETTNDGGRALMGSFSDRERLAAQQAGRNTARFSRKPSGEAVAVEIVTVGETYLRAEPMSVGIGNLTNGPRLRKFTIAGEGYHTLTAGTESVKVYAVPSSPDRYWLRFVNGLGVVESVSVASLVSEDVNYKVSEYVVARQELFNQVSRGAVVKQNDQERLKLSSGPIDRLWQQWYLHELLPTPQAWIWIDGLWIPCHIVPEETVSGISRADGKLLEVQFTVRLDIAGSPYSALAV